MQVQILTCTSLHFTKRGRGACPRIKGEIGAKPKAEFDSQTRTIASITNQGSLNSGHGGQ